MGRNRINRGECKIEGCNKPARAKGFCWMHYCRVRAGIEDMRPGYLPKKWKPDDPRYETKTWFCSVAGCCEKHYALGFCHTHYELNRRNGKPIRLRDLPKPKCSVDSCKNLATSLTSGFCRFHRTRKMNGIPLNRPKGVTGPLNHNWNGGVSQYPNHYKMKKLRLEILKDSDYTCHYCSKPANQIHHKDLSKDNHKEDNLVACCGSCNTIRCKIKTSKYRRIYNKTLKELANELNICQFTVVRWHKSGKLMSCLPTELQMILN